MSDDNRKNVINKTVPNDNASINSNTNTNTNKNRININNNNAINGINIDEFKSNIDNSNNNEGKKFTLKQIGLKSSIDGAVGVFAGISLAFFITPLDSMVMQGMSGQTTMLQSLKNSMSFIATKPHRYIYKPEYKFVAGTYGATYLTKNFTDTFCSVTNQTPERSALMKFWFVFAVNGGLSVFWKDPGLANIFSPHLKNQKTPKPTIISWILRDTIHVLGAAVLPDYLEERYHLTQEQWRVLQLTFPLLTQTITTPFHLMGLDFYNHSESSLSDRLGRVARRWAPSTGIRMIRMFAPWSIGLLINRDLREYLNKSIDN